MGDGMDRADIKTLHVLIVGGKPHAITTLRTVFGIIGLTKVSAVAESARAIEWLREERVDVVFCDEHADHMNGLPFPMAARRAPGVPNPMLPIFLVFSTPVRPQIERARDDGITDVIVRPISAATIMRKLRAATLCPRPFIVAGSFFGPDRRGGSRSLFRGEDRRQRQPKKVKIAPHETASFLTASVTTEAVQVE